MNSGATSATADHWIENPVIVVTSGYGCIESSFGQLVDPFGAIGDGGVGGLSAWDRMTGWKINELIHPSILRSLNHSIDSLKHAKMRLLTQPPEAIFWLNPNQLGDVIEAHHSAVAWKSLLLWKGEKMTYKGQQIGHGGMREIVWNIQVGLLCDVMFL